MVRPVSPVAASALGMGSLLVERSEPVPGVPGRRPCSPGRYAPSARDTV